MCWMKSKPLAAFFRSFGFAARGVARCFRERNFRVHTVAAVLVPLLARHFLDSRIEWAVLLLTIALVLAAEAVNTAVEAAVDLSCPEQNPKAGAAKDAAAGAVLLCAPGAVVVAVCLFSDAADWIALFSLWRDEWWRPTALAAFVPLAAWFVFHK